MWFAHGHYVRTAEDAPLKWFWYSARCPNLKSLKSALHYITYLSLSCGYFFLKTLIVSITLTDYSYFCLVLKRWRSKMYYFIVILCLRCASEHDWWGAASTHTPGTFTWTIIDPLMIPSGGGIEEEGQRRGTGGGGGEGWSGWVGWWTSWDFAGTLLPP